MKNQSKKDYNRIRSWDLKAEILNVKAGIIAVSLPVMDLDNVSEKILKELQTTYTTHSIIIQQQSDAFWFSGDSNGIVINSLPIAKQLIQSGVRLQEKEERHIISM